MEPTQKRNSDIPLEPNSESHPVAVADPPDLQGLTPSRIKEASNILINCRNDC
jgi:hypothetical protein